MRCADTVHSKEKTSRAEANTWFAPSGQSASAAEPLFLALVLCAEHAAHRTLSKLEKWATDALAALEPLQGQNQHSGAAALPNGPDWSMRFNKTGKMLEHLHTALFCRQWREGDMDAIGAAMQSWRGVGRHDGLKHSHLGARHLQACRRRAP